eukprot:5684180-Prymnesium_polylepis.1
MGMGVRGRRPPTARPAALVRWRFGRAACMPAAHAVARAPTRQGPTGAPAAAVSTGGVLGGGMGAMGMGMR